jgi:SAM-dependent methyltransferase
MKNNKGLQCCTTTCGLPLNSEYWDNQYKLNETGWDLNEVSPPIKAYIDQLENKNISVLIAGCGNAYEAQYLYQSGITNITLVDISETLINNLQQKYANTTIKVLHKDIFELKGKFDLIIEQTLFCAIDPSLRKQFVATMSDLLSEKGKLVGLLFNRLFENQGPPFGGDKDEYQKLFSSYFIIKTMDSCYNSVDSRSNTELFINLSKKNIS